MNKSTLAEVAKRVEGKGEVPDARLVTTPVTEISLRSKIYHGREEALDKGLISFGHCQKAKKAAPRVLYVFW